MVVVASCGAIFGQETNNTAYFELLGNGGPASLNYERHFRPNSAVRIGVSSWRLTESSLGSVNERTSVTAFPLMVNHFRGAGRHKLELGGGVLVGQLREQRLSDQLSESSIFVNATATVGYRYQKAQRGVIFRAGWTPFYGFGDSDETYVEGGFLNSIGFSVGYGF